MRQAKRTPVLEPFLSTQWSSFLLLVILTEEFSMRTFVIVNTSCQVFWHNSVIDDLTLDICLAHVYVPCIVDQDWLRLHIINQLMIIDLLNTYF